MTSKEALRLLVDGFLGYEKARKEVSENYCDIVNLLIKDLELLEKHKQIEKELGIDLITLFSQKYKRSDDLEVEEEKTIYFCGDSYYGHWTKEEWLDFIKEVISAYRELVKLGR